MKPSADYHDYVIKDGRFVGEFDEMYRHCDDPWDQDAGPTLAQDIALLILGRHRGGRLLDLGCGKGRFTRRIQEATGAAITAIDISPTAVAAARTRFQGIEFSVGAVPPLTQCADESFDLVVCAELLWYVLPELPLLFREIGRVLRHGGHCLLIQHFYQPGSQQYGNELMQTPEDLIAMLPFRIVSRIDVDRSTNHEFIALLSKNRLTPRELRSSWHR
jgi:ubiquinone/menaquinone biosynthesis C-methylase UbiE